MVALRIFRIFLSSPSDVADERVLARRLIEQQLRRDPSFRHRAVIEAVTRDPDLQKALERWRAVKRFFDRFRTRRPPSTTRRRRATAMRRPAMVPWRPGHDAFAHRLTAA
jgi:hypothetical protein